MKSVSDIADRFTEWCKTELFTKDVVRATAILNRYCDLRLMGVVRDLDLTSKLAQPTTPAALAEALGFVDSAEITLRYALHRLAARTDIVTTSDGTTFQVTKTPDDPTDELATLRTELEGLGKDYLAAVDFLDFGAEHFVVALKDDPDFMDKMLAGRTGDWAELWHRATNVDPLQDLHGEMGARAISDLLDGGTILEIGGGTGNGIRHLFAMMKREGTFDRLERYIFTDISMRFVLTTKHEMDDNYPDVATAWKFCDLNKPLSEQKIEESSVDLIYAVNAAHVAKDIVAFLESCRWALKPGGVVLFAERVRMTKNDMAPRELTLNLSVYHRTAAEKASYRSMHCYLEPSEWREVLERAGFEPHILPNLEAMGEHFPDQYAAVVVGSKKA